MPDVHVILGEQVKKQNFSYAPWFVLASFAQGSNGNEGS